MSVVHNLFTAAQSNDLDLMREALLTADVNMRSESENFTPLMIAANYGFYDMVDMLLTAGANVNAQSEGGSTALSLAISPKYEESAKIVKRLLDAGADVNLVSGVGNTPLMEAVYQGSMPVVDLLLKAGANVNIVNNHGETALMTVLIGGDEPEIITRLLDSGADKESLSTAGEQAADIAHRLGRIQSFRVLCS